MLLVSRLTFIREGFSEILPILVILPVFVSTAVVVAVLLLRNKNKKFVTAL